jgi:hypothetical protein
MRTELEVADIFRTHGGTYREQFGSRMPLQHKKAMRSIEICRTSELGGHIDRCDTCEAERISYNSCRSRHCPKCQFLKTERWIEDRKADLLPIPYFHVVFTLPQELRSLALANQRVIYDLLFKAASETLIELAADDKYLGAKIGLVAVLHTWSQTLVHHPHVHCIVTGGGLAKDGGWRASRADYLLPVKVLSRLYRGKMLDKLKTAERTGALQGGLDRSTERDLYAKEWTVYCKRPFASADHVVAYLGRYTHRIAISNHRLIDLDGDSVRFRYRDSAHGNQRKIMKLDGLEFIRRFLLHVLPHGFVKIRHYGLLGNRCRRADIRVCRQRLLGIWEQSRQKEVKSWEEVLLQVAGIDTRKCPHCGGNMGRVEGLAPERVPPV